MIGRGGVVDREAGTVDEGPVFRAGVFGQGVAADVRGAEWERRRRAIQVEPLDHVGAGVDRAGRVDESFRFGDGYVDHPRAGSADGERSFDRRMAVRREGRATRESQDSKREQAGERSGPDGAPKAHVQDPPPLDRVHSVAFLLSSRACFSSFAACLRSVLARLGLAEPAWRLSLLACCPFFFAAWVSFAQSDGTTLFELLAAVVNVWSGPNVVPMLLLATARKW